MSEFIAGRKLIDELIKQGIADEMTSRVTIDIPAKGVPTVYIEKVGDKRLIDIMPALTAGAVVTAQMDNANADARLFDPDTVAGPYSRHSVPRKGDTDDG